MAIKKPIPITFSLDSHQSVQSACAVIHIDDKNTEMLDLSLMQGGEHIAVSQNSTVTARFVRVKDKILISDNVPCAVQENGNIHIPIDNAAAHMLVGEIKIEVNIVDENDILTMQFPLVIKVNNTILADAEISPESEGTIPELLEEAREAAEDAAQAAKAATEAISTKQDKLTAGENITISEENVISASSVSNDYTDLINKPSINNVTLSGNKSSDDLNLQGKLTAGQNITIEGNVISAEGGVTDYAQLSNLPKILYRESTYISAFGDLIGELKPRGDIIYFTKSNEGYYIQVDPKTVFTVRRYDVTSVDNLAKDESFVLTSNSFTDLPNFANRNSILVQYADKASNSGNYVQFLYWRDSIGKLHTAQRINTKSTFGTWEEVSSGATIVSGVVNVNGTITFTDSEGNSFTTSGESVIGADGFSPVATVTQTASGATVSITDSTGTTTANISNGQDGTDYVLTNADKQEIAQMAVNLLPNADMVSY